MAACFLSSSVALLHFPFFCSSVWVFSLSSHLPWSEHTKLSSLLLRHLFIHQFLFISCYFSLFLNQSAAIFCRGWFPFFQLLLTYFSTNISKHAFFWRKSPCSSIFKTPVLLVQFPFVTPWNAPGPRPIFINIVLMIPDGLTWTVWGRSVSVFFQGCAWAIVCVGMHACWLCVCTGSVSAHVCCVFMFSCKAISR